MSPAFRVRPAIAADCEAIAGFNLAMAAETEGRTLEPATVRAGVAAVLAEPAHGRYFVAEAGSPVGGLLVTYEWSDWRNGLFWWIQSVYVEPHWRRRGVFSGLFAHVREQARAADAAGLRLYVERGNHDAQRTYTRLGMQATSYLVFETPPA